MKARMLLLVLAIVLAACMPSGKTPYYSGATRAAFAAAGISYSMK